MAITRESLIARKTELTAALEQVRSQAAALQGALADTEFWLTRVDDDADTADAEKKD